jgi:hypothetical protein
MRDKMTSTRVGACPKTDCKYKVICGADIPNNRCYEKM